MTDEHELLDDPEAMTLEPLDDLETSSELWDWVPPWGRQNGWGADRDVWGDSNPPLTTRLREKLHPVEVAHYEGKPFMRHLIVHASRKMSWQPIGGWTAEDVAMDALEAVLPLGFEIGGASWVKLTRRVMNRKIADLLKAQRARTENVVQGYPHDRSDAPEFVSQVFSDELVERLRAVLTSRELEAVLYIYQDDLSNAQAAERMGVNVSTVTSLASVARSKLRGCVSGF